MKFVCKTKIEKAWLASSMLMFVAHRLLEFPAPAHHWSSTPLGMWLEVAMILLTFPLGGLTLLVLQVAAFSCDGCGDLEWMLDWSTLLFAGYIQWFWLMPEILRKRELTFLDLKRLPETVSPNLSTPDAAPTRAALEPASPVVLETAPLPAFVPSLAEFDEAGLTALDRVFQAQASSPAPASPSHVEAIFPRVS